MWKRIRSWADNRTSFFVFSHPIILHVEQCIISNDYLLKLFLLFCLRVFSINTVWMYFVKIVRKNCHFIVPYLIYKYRTLRHHYNSFHYHNQFLFSFWIMNLYCKCAYDFISTILVFLYKSKIFFGCFLAPRKRVLFLSCKKEIL